VEVITSHQAVADVKIVEMEAIIADPEQKLANCKNHELPRWQLLLDQKDIALADIQARSDRQSIELQQAKQDAAQFRQVLIHITAIAAAQYGHPRRQRPRQPTFLLGRNGTNHYGNPAATSRDGPAIVGW
jgi:hypothetical protein